VGHNRWHEGIAPVVEVAPGEEIEIQTHDAFDGQIPVRPEPGPCIDWSGYVVGAAPGDPSIVPRNAAIAAENAAIAFPAICIKNVPGHGPNLCTGFSHRGKPDGPADHPESPFYKREKPPRYRGVAVARRALSPTLDRKAFIDILVEGQGLIGGAMQPPPDGVWGLPGEKLAELPGYSSDVAKNRAEARAIMERLGYGPNKRLAVTVSTRNTAGYRDPAVIAIDQMKEIYIDGTLEPIETANWFPKVIRKDYTVGANISETAVDDPDQMFYENYACGSDRNYTGFCDKEVDALIDRQSAEPNAEKRRQLVWEIERRLARDASRPIIFYTRVATCWRPRVKGLNLVVNSVFNSWRFEDVWLDR